MPCFSGGLWLVDVSEFRVELAVGILGGPGVELATKKLVKIGMDLVTDVRYLEYGSVRRVKSRWGLQLHVAASAFIGAVFKEGPSQRMHWLGFGKRCRNFATLGVRIPKFWTILVCFVLDPSTFRMRGFSTSGDLLLTGRRCLHVVVYLVVSSACGRSA